MLSTQNELKQIVKDCGRFSAYEISRTSSQDRAVFATPVEAQNSESLRVRNNTLRISEIMKAINVWKKLAPHNEGQQKIDILELGLGYADVAISASRLHKGNVTGIEHPNRGFFFAPEYIIDLRRNNVKAVAANLLNHNLPFADNSYDLCLFCEVIEHLPPTIVPQTLAEIARVTKPGGGVIIATPNLASLVNRLVFLSGATIFSPSIPLDYAGGTYGHIRLYSPDEVNVLAQTVGLKLYRIWYCNSMLHSGEERFAVKLLKYTQQLLSIPIHSLANSWTGLFTKSTI
ncbi:MAG TPA: hypothetical protein DCL15_06870 [Chloroflexi bacterium]|nr:hypothetical protein [Chloroflexota bacterium]HHW87790.1 class I SAM-dependent methyltransferase [Chloroflexota bacterium]